PQRRLPGANPGRLPPADGRLPQGRRCPGGGNVVKRSTARYRHPTERTCMAPSPKPRTYRFTFGPWNISTGADPFGPPVRQEVALAAKVREYKKLGFDGVQFHDDDVVPDIDSDPAAIEKTAAKVKKMLDGEGLFCEIIAPR